MRNKWGDRNATTGKLTADQLQYRADVRLMAIGIIVVTLIMAAEVIIWNI